MYARTGKNKEKFYKIKGMKNNTNKFSVLMSVYEKDKVEYLKQALDSVLNQTVKPDEVILVKDGPLSDELNRCIHSYDKNAATLKVVSLEKNRGLGIALRIGMEHCSNELIARMDSDDICVPDRFERQLKAFENNPDISMVGGYIEEFTESPDKPVGIRKVPESDKDIQKYMRKRCPFNHVSVMLKKSEVLKAGGYLEWHYNEDYYLWIRMMLEECKFYNIPEVLVHVRVGKDMYQRRGGINYFRSEAKLQSYMYQQETISIFEYFYNVAVRFVIQILMSNKIRGWFFRKFARTR